MIAQDIKYAMARLLAFIGALVFYFNANGEVRPLFTFILVFLALSYALQRLWSCTGDCSEGAPPVLDREFVPDSRELIPLGVPDTGTVEERLERLTWAYRELKGFVEVLNMVSGLLGRREALDITMQKAVCALGRLSGSDICMIMLLDNVVGQEGTGGKIYGHAGISPSHVIYGTDRSLALRIAGRIDEKRIKRGEGAHRLIKIVRGPGYLDRDEISIVKDLVYLTMVDHDEILGLLILPRIAGRTYARREESGVLRAITTLLIHAIQGQRIDEKFRRMDRLAELGRMAAGVAHEIRNPLGGIEILATFLADKLKEDHDSAVMARDITVAVRKLERIVGGLLDYARDENLKRRECSLKDLIHEAVQYARARDGSGVIMFNQRIDYNLPPLLCDPDRMSQALLNLLINAVQAVENQAQYDPENQTSCHRRTDSADQGRHEDNPESAGSSRPVIEVSARLIEDAIVIEVVDNGPGIPDKLGQRIFEPFVTGRATGTGLGLPISRKIVESHGGKLEFDSEYDEGSLARIILPVHNVTVEKEDAPLVSGRIADASQNED